MHTAEQKKLTKKQAWILAEIKADRVVTLKDLNGQSDSFRALFTNSHSAKFFLALTLAGEQALATGKWVP